MQEEDTLLIAACKEGDCEAAGLLIGAKADVCHANSVGNTPLHICAAKGNIETAALLLKSGAKIGAKNSDGATPISVAMAAGDANMCDLLLAQGARVCKKEIDGKCSKEVRAHDQSLLCAFGQSRLFECPYLSWRCEHVRLVLVSWRESVQEGRGREVLEEVCEERMA